MAHTIMTWRPPCDAPFWCEENAWHLCVLPEVGPDAHVVVISNPSRTVAMWHQRAASPPQRAVVWDYHVMVVGADGRAWDPDTRLGLPIALGAWVAGTFSSVTPPPLRPRFRVIAAADYRARFGSDRRHMRTDAGEWQQPPPAWPPIGTEHVLDVLLDQDDPAFGPWLDEAALLAMLQRP